MMQISSTFLSHIQTQRDRNLDRGYTALSCSKPTRFRVYDHMDLVRIGVGYVREIREPIFFSDHKKLSPKRSQYSVIGE